MNFKQDPNRIYQESPTGVLLAEITFHPGPDGTMVLDHTFVDDSLQGQGIAGKLVQAAVARLRGEGYHISATCSYAAQWLRQHPEALG